MNQPGYVLYIDDDEDDHFLLQMAIKEYDSSIALIKERDSEEAIKKLKEGRIIKPDMIILDWNMPKLSGVQCLQAIRGIPRFTNTFVVILTTSEQSAPKREIEDLNAAIYRKPSTLEGIVGFIRVIFAEWLKNSH